jgi:hypothetical protein
MAANKPHSRTRQRDASSRRRSRRRSNAQRAGKARIPLVGPPIDPKALYNVEAAAPAVLSNPRTMERWRKEGKGPRFVKVGRRVAYRGEALLDYLRAQERSHTGEPRNPVTTS